VKVAIVVQRYGAEINGGAELHARYIAERLARHVQVEVLTTCATDYVTWRNSLPATVDTVRGVTVRRFPVQRERDPDDFGRWSERVFRQVHALRDELAWLDAEGPTSPELVTYIRQHESSYGFLIFFSFRYYHSYHGARAVPSKAILVPTAERDGALGLGLFGPIFRGVRAIMYNSFEERALIHAVSHNQDVAGVVVGVGSDIPENANPTRFRQKFNFRERFAIYVGRIDENKGCGELFDFFQRYSRTMADGMHLVLIGTPIIPIPEHPRIHHLGFVGDQDKFDAMAAAELLIMPSYFESLSMVALEAWALGRPVLANGKCDVLRGQCVRSNGGLYYENFEEFLETLRAIDMGPALAATLGRNGREYFSRHYSWPIIERKYIDMLDRLRREPPARAMEPLPGWFARRKRNLPAADDVVAALPTGPALERAPAGREAASPVSEPRATVSRPEPPPSMPLTGDRPQPPRTEAWRPQAARSPGARPQTGDRRRPQQRGRRPQTATAQGQAQPSSGARSSRADRPEGRGPRRRRRGGPPRKPNDR
jgi:glycosyltransferase involved in cell wall biosynthesis